VLKLKIFQKSNPTFYFAEDNIKKKNFLDITSDSCPITFVKVLLALDELSVGEVLEIHLTGESPLKNVPRSLKASGHNVLSLFEIEQTNTFSLLVEKCGVTNV